MRRNTILLIAFGASVALAAFAAQASVTEDVEYDSLPPDNEWLPEYGYDEQEGNDMIWKINEYPRYARVIRESERRYNIPSDLLARALSQESSFLPEIINGTRRSPVGAVGIAQFMPATAKDYGLILSDGTDLRTDPFASIDAAGRYLRALYLMFNSWPYALMAYNWGPGNMQSYLKSGVGVKGQPLPDETANYVAKITADVPVA